MLVECTLQDGSASRLVTRAQTVKQDDANRVREGLIQEKEEETGGDQ